MIIIIATIAPTHKASEKMKSRKNRPKYLPAPWKKSGASRRGTRRPMPRPGRRSRPQRVQDPAAEEDREEPVEEHHEDAPAK